MRSIEPPDSGLAIFCTNLARESAYGAINYSSTSFTWIFEFRWCSIEYMTNPDLASNDLSGPRETTNQLMLESLLGAQICGGVHR